MTTMRRAGVAAAAMAAVLATTSGYAQTPNGGATPAAPAGGPAAAPTAPPPTAPPAAAAAQPAPPAAAPSTPTPPAASTTQAPAVQPEAPTAAQAPAAGQPATGQAPAAAQTETTLPKVEVIQEAPKPKPAVETPAPKPKKPVEAAAPPPAPAPKQAAAPRPKVAPKPVEQAPAAPQPAAPVEAATATSPVTSTAVTEGQIAPDVVRMSPTAGSEIALEKVPGAVSGVSAAAIQSSGTPNTTDALMQRVPGVIVNDVQGNAFQQDVQYHGFSASSVNGTPQGIAVYQNGVRINEIFGDTVNWDLIPSVAINDMTVVGNNPVYGLNAIGGAISIGMKDGFNFHGFEADGRIGSFGRRQGSIQWGQQSGAVAAYLALEGVHDSGWRDASHSNVRRMYTDLGFKGSLAEFHLNFTGAQNTFGAAATVPIEMAKERWGSIYTTPQSTRNELALLSANGAVKSTPTLTLTGNVYWRSFRQKHVDGNVSDVVECQDQQTDPTTGETTTVGTGKLCFDETDNLLNGPIPFDGALLYGSVDRTSVTADGIGGSIQAVEKSRIFDRGNQFLMGVSIDHGRLTSKASSELGFIDSNLNVNGMGYILSDAGGTDAVDAIKPIDLGVRTDYYGFFVSNAFDVTDQLTVTAGGRYNIAKLRLADQTGNAPELDGNHKYERFNPMIGATYKLLPNMTVYGGYSEANRAPTPSELACADPNRPCILEAFLVADPPLKQVVSHTYEAGLRGFANLTRGSRLDWSVGYYHTENTDDIIAVASAQQGRGYFLNAGKTLRQGVDVALAYKQDRFTWYAGYSFTDATFQTPMELASPNNPQAQFCTGADPAVDTPSCIFVTKGNRIPSVPQHKFKLGFDYFVLPEWKVGADFIATSNQYLRGDEANLNAPISGYNVLNLHTSYDITKNMQVYGLFQNVLDSRYYNFGTFFNPQDVAAVRALSDPRTVSPGAPFAAYGGLKVKF